MASGTTLTEKHRKEAQARLQELQPALEEAQELERYLKVLGDAGRGHKRRRTSTGSGRSPQRANEFIALVAEHPGITVAEAAKKMGIPPNYLYRVAGDLAKTGKVAKEGSTYRPAGGTDADKKEKEDEKEPAVA